MKKIGLMIVFLLGLSPVFAGGPLHFKVGVIGLHSNTWLLSSNYNKGFTESSPSFTWSTNLGAVASIYFADRLGVEVEAIFGKYRQKFSSTSSLFGVSVPQDYETEISKIDVPVLVKFGKLIYIEAGPQFTFVSKVEETAAGLGTEETTNFYNSNQMFGVAGMGIGVGIPKIVQFEGGIRAGYGFNDYNGSIPRYDGKVTPFFWGIKLMAVHKF